MDHISSSDAVELIQVLDRDLLAKAFLERKIALFPRIIVDGEIQSNVLDHILMIEQEDGSGYSYNVNLRETGLCYIRFADQHKTHVLGGFTEDGKATCSSDCHCHHGTDLYCEGTEGKI